jgi:hypothetical protein
VNDAHGQVSPEPTEEEAVAITAAMQTLFSAGGAVEPGREPVSRWRFSGRWWSRPVASRRSRPSGS